MSTCERCKDTGLEDSGGVQPWGEPILVECECRLMERNMDESRKQFLESFSKIMASDELRIPEDVIKICWEIWQASRAAIEIKLPTENELHQKVCSGCASESVEMVEQAIRAAGIKVKE